MLVNGVIERLARRPVAGLMPLSEALSALGEAEVMGRRDGEVPVAQVVGSVGRAGDFDDQFGLRNSALRGRWRQVAAVMEAGQEAPVELVQLGELYFVVDGHHRVSVARALGWSSITARVLRICTVAYAMGCLRLAHLASKSAERSFLERVPLPDEVRVHLWLDEPADWARLADAAEAWGFRRSFTGRALSDREELAGRWWAEEVIPALVRLRSAGFGLDLRDVEAYAGALAARDRLGWTSWPADTAEIQRLADNTTPARDASR